MTSSKGDRFEGLCPEAQGSTSPETDGEVRVVGQGVKERSVRYDIVVSPVKIPEFVWYERELVRYRGDF